MATSGLKWVKLRPKQFWDRLRKRFHTCRSLSVVSWKMLRLFQIWRKEHENLIRIGKTAIKHLGQKGLRVTCAKRNCAFGWFPDRQVDRFYAQHYCRSTQLPTSGFLWLFGAKQSCEQRGSRERSAENSAWFWWFGCLRTAQVAAHRPITRVHVTMRVLFNNLDGVGDLFLRGRYFEWNNHRKKNCMDRQRLAPVKLH